MNDPDNTLEILINLRAKIDEAIGARRALEEVKQAETAGAATSEDAARATEKLNVSHRELHRLLHGLPPQFSQAGYAFTSLFYNPVFAGMLAITAIYQVVKKHLDDYNKSLDEIGAKAAEADFLPGIEAKMDVLRTGARDMQTWLDTLAQEQSGEEGITKALAEQLGLMSAIATAKNAQAKAEEALAIAKIKQGQVSGRISPADADRQIAEAHAKAVATEQAAKEKAQQDQLGTKSTDLLGLEGIQKILKPLAEAAKQAQTEDEAHQARLKADADTARGKLPDLNKALAGPQATLEDLNRNLQNPDLAAPTRQALEAAKTKAEEAVAGIQREITGWQKIISQFTVTQTPEAIKGEQSLKDARERLIKQEDETAKAIGDLKTQVAELTKTIAGTTSPERATSRAKQQTIYTEAITNEEKRAVADAKTLGEYAGRPRDSLNSADIAKIKAAIADRDAALADAAAMISELAAAGADTKQIDQFRADLRAVRERVTALEYSK